ncbi:MAG: hypothetical protein GDA51_05210 [Ekhidna sp.]|nr:hypothetical protein [Ekhidna sp.]
MKIVVDTNIVFSSILNSNGLIGELLFNTGQQFDFYSPEFMVRELDKYGLKLKKYTSMTQENIKISIQQVLKNIALVSPEAISAPNWEHAYELASEADEKDTPFVATALGINGSIWTGDKKLIKGLRKKGVKNIYSTTELFERTK